MAKADLTAQQVREVFEYNAETGSFVWRERGPHLFETERHCKIWNAKFAGRAAGSITRYGYRVICVLGSSCIMAHRLAWLYVNGSWPSGQIDHINGVRSDNRISNLRDVDAATNSQNRRYRTGKDTSLPMGVWEMKVGRRRKKPYAASIRVNGRAMHLGYFSTPEEAGAAYIEAKRIHHAGCTI